MYADDHQLSHAAESIKEVVSSEPRREQSLPVVWRKSIER